MFPQAHFLSQPYEFQTVFETFPEIRLTLDIVMRILAVEKINLRSLSASMVTESADVHANDNFGKEDSHLPIGAGSLISKGL